MNRVNFKGVVEKDELLKHVARLWKQEHKAQQGNFSFHEIFVKILTVFFFQLKIEKSLFGNF